jgi:uncharacterized membrane protein YdbT with pleckstrin-like domain
MATEASHAPERVILETRQHWLSAGMWWRLLVVLALLIGSAALLITAVVVPPLGLGLLGVVALAWVFLVFVPYLRWRTQVYRLTDRRLIIEDGIITRRAKSLPLARLQEVTSEVGLLGRILGYGTLRVENAGDEQSHDVLEDIPDPIRFKELLLEHAATARQDGL